MIVRKAKSDPPARIFEMLSVLAKAMVPLAEKAERTFSRGIANLLSFGLFFNLLTCRN